MSARTGFSLAALMFLISFPAVGAMLYTPALPVMSQQLGIDEGKIQLTMTFYLIGYAIGQLPYGPLANALGRRCTIYIGCLVGIIGSVICALASELWLLSFGRFIQALGMAVGLVLGFTLVGDLYVGKAARRATAYINLAFAIIPAAGVALGGFAAEHLGWRSCFWFTAGYAGLIALLTVSLPKTGPEPDLDQLRLGKILRGYWNQIRNPLILIGSLMFGLAFMAFYVFAVEAPFIGINQLGLTADLFGLYTIIIYAGAVIGCLVAAQLSQRLSDFPLISIALALIGMASIMMLLVFMLGEVAIWKLFLPAAVIFLGLPLHDSVITSAITTRAEDKSNAAAFMTFVGVALGVVAVLFVGRFSPKNALVMPSMFVVIWAMLVGLCLALYRVWRERI